MSQANLTPQEQQVLFRLMQKQGAQPTSGGMSQDTPDPTAQQGSGEVDANGLAQLFGQQQPPQLQAQEGDKMHPHDAIQTIMQKLGPQLSSGPNGTYELKTPSENPILKFFGAKDKTRLEPTNYYDLFRKQAPGMDLEGLNLPRTPDGKPFMPNTIYSELVKAKSLLPSSNNPPIDKKQFLALHLGDSTQANELFGDDPNKTVPLTELRLGVLGEMSKTRKGMLSLGRDKFEQAQIDGLIKGIADSQQSNSTPMGQQANKLNAVIHARQLLTQGYNPDTHEYDLAKAASQEAIMGVARAISPTGQLSEQTQKDLSSPTAYGRMAGLIQFWTGKPVNAQPQAIVEMYRDMLDRQGAISQDLFNTHAARELPKGLLLKEHNPLAYAAVMQNSFGTHDYRSLVANGVDGDVSKVPAPIDLGGRGTQPPPPTGKSASQKGTGKTSRGTTYRIVQ